MWNAGEIADYFTLSFKGVVKRIAKKAPKEQVKEYAADAAKKLAKKAFLVYNKKYGTKYTQEEIELMFSEVFDYLIEKSTDSFIDISEEELLEQEVADVADHIHAYKQSILDGHGVILVAHSQGNLFVNRAYNEFGKVSDINKDAWMKAYIHAIGVASPANNILGEASPYMTFDNDVIQVVPDSLATNVTNPTRYFFRNALDEDVETLLSVRAHSFLTSYMATDITRNSILDFINTQIDDHKNALSQWETDQELNKDTKDYRITVKHRFDPNITEMDGVEVFPFTLSKKLYYVDGDIAGYVKASCGGMQILDTWIDQQSDEVYLINNLQEEKIILHGMVFTIRYRSEYIDYANSYDVYAGGIYYDFENNDNNFTCNFSTWGSSGYLYNSYNNPFDQDRLFAGIIQSYRNNYELNYMDYENKHNHYFSSDIKCMLNEKGYTLDDIREIRRGDEKKYIVDLKADPDLYHIDGYDAYLYYIIEQKYIISFK